MAPRIRIARDVDGVAHVRAASMLDAFEGQGFAAAEDRIWQMELDRRRALGRLAEVVGGPGLGPDTFHRALGLAEHARRSFDALTAETRAVLEAYAAGVDRYLATGPDLPAELAVLDIEPASWEPWHSIALYEVRHLAMGTYEAKMWRSGLVHHLGPDALARLWPSIPEVMIDPAAGEQVVPLDPTAGMGLGAAALASFAGATAAPIEGGSNNLAIAASRTATGRPILAGDPHRAIDLPNVYWQNHLTCTDPDDPLDVIGLSFPGVPGFPHFGHNTDVAWCITHGMADDQDLFVVELRRGDSGTVEYRDGGGWRRAQVRTEEIPVAGAAPLRVELIATHHGPVVAGQADGDPAPAIALRWTATAGLDTTFDALVPMMRAASTAELDDSLAPWVVPVNNVLVADTAGSIAYRMRGRVAIRDAGNGWTAVPGDDPERAWRGFVDDADLPRWRDPERGFLVTANNRVSADSPYVSHDFAHPTRARRLVERLGAHDAWDVDDVAALLGDTHSRVAATLARRLLAGVTPTSVDARALGVLVDWDGHMDAGSPAAALVGTVRAELVRLLCHELDLTRDRLPEVPGPTLHQTLRLVNARLASWGDDPSLVSDDVLASALRFAVRDLTVTQGPDPAGWRWGAAHLARWAHPLLALRPDLADRLALPPALELGGDNECVWATSTAPPSTDASNAQVARYVFDVGDWDRSRWIVPHGVSGDSRSAHHLDQLEDWAGMRLRPMRWSPSVVDAATAAVTDLD